MAMIDPKKFGANVIKLLHDQPARYRNFGVYWYFVKELLKRIGYTKDNLYMLGDYRDDEVINAMPAHKSLNDAIAAACDVYATNSANNIGRNVIFTDDGEKIVLLDEDAGL